MLLTQPGAPHRKSPFLDNGLKIAEVFTRDISLNLVRWGSKEDTTYFETKEFWYSEETAPAISESVFLRRFNIETHEQVSVWSDPYSLKTFKEKWPVTSLGTKEEL